MRRNIPGATAYGYAKTMVMLTDLSDARKCQPHLLDRLNGNPARDARRQKLMELADRIMGMLLPAR